MVFRVRRGKRKVNENIFRFKVKNETAQDYLYWIKKLESLGWSFIAIVCDGILWIRDRLNIPIQMCHFHQKKNIRKYLTKNPILEPNIKLNYLVYQLWNISEQDFRRKLKEWRVKYDWFMKEKSYNYEGKWRYIHHRTRSAYNSLNRNLPYLFNYKNSTFDIPNTTNSIEWMFWQLKKKIRVHPWLRDDRKYKLVCYLLNS